MPALLAVLAAAVAALAVLAPPKPNLVRIQAHDFAYTLPDSLPAGLTTIEMTNDGRELHHAIFFRLEGGKRLPDLLEAMKAGAEPRWAVPVGGPEGPAPGRTASATLNLRPGRYAVLCVIPSGDGIPHVMKGMAKEVMVTGKGVAKAEMPRADVHLTMKDYDFVFDRPLRAGKQVVQVDVAPGQPHEIVVVKLAPGKTIEDFAQWAEKPAGPPPADMVGGISPMVGGHPAQFTLDLSPGEYGLICFVPDGKDGKPHFLHGMQKQLKVAG
jgi:uncharacterized cupredoxin-like copper-binding protein